MSRTVETISANHQKTEKTRALSEIEDSDRALPATVRGVIPRPVQADRLLWSSS